MTDNKPAYQNRKTLVGLLVRPKQQIRLAAYFIAGTIVIHLALMIILIRGMDDLSALGIASLVLSAALLLSAYAALMGIWLNHRVFGPIVSLKRFIATLREGDYTPRVQLRATDEMNELKDSLNDLAAALEERHGPGRRPS